MKILVVDDEILVRRSLERLFKAHHHDVTLAEDGLAGLSLWRDKDFDVVFLDILMPGLSGPQVLAEIGPRRKGKVVLMSAFTGEHNFETAKSLGADLFISKPFENVMGIMKQIKELGV